MKLFRLLPAIVLGTMILSASTYAQSTGDTASNPPTPAAKLETAKNIATSKLQTKYDSLYRKYVTDNTSSSLAHLQALSCLDIVKFPGYEEYLSGEKETLRNQMIEDYIQYKMQLERKDNGIAIDESALESNIDAFLTIYNARIEQFGNDVEQKIQTVEQEVQSYGQQNDALLKNVSRKIIQLKQIQDKESALENQVFEFNNLYLRHEANLLDIINKQKNALQSGLREQTQSSIERDKERFSSFIGYAQALQAKQDAQIRLFSLDFDEAVQGIIGDRYDPSVYQRLQDQLERVNETFYVDEELNCQSLLTTSLDVDGYLQSISSNIQQLEEGLAQGVQSLSETGAADAFKGSVFTALQAFYTEHTQDLLQTFRTFKSEQFSLRSSRIVAQRTKVQELQEMKTRHDKAQSGERKSLATQIITQAQILYEQAYAQDIKNNSKILLESLGIVLEPEVSADDDQELLASSNSFVQALHQLARKLQRSNKEFAQALTNAETKLETKAADAAGSHKAQLEKLLQAVQLYVQAYRE